MSDIEREIAEFVARMREKHGGTPTYALGSALGSAPGSAPGSDRDSSPGRPKVLYSGPVWDEREMTAVIKSVLCGKWFSSGEQVRIFESQFSRAVGVAESVMVNSGSSANLVMLAALKKRFGWPDGGEVIVSTVGFPTTLNAILQNGLTPRFVDISWSDLNWDLEAVREALNERTVAVFSSPALGNPYDLDALLEMLTPGAVALIGDNCDSLGSRWRGRDLAEYCVASSCSFYPAHHISTGEGGMVSSNDREVVRLARSFAWWGRDCYCVGAANLLPQGTCGQRFSRWIEDYDVVLDHKYLFVNVGYNLKPLDLQGAIGQVQLEKLPEIHRKRRAHKQQIQASLETRPGLRVPEELEPAETSWFGVPIVCDDSQLKRRLVEHFETSGIQTRNYFAGNILVQPAYRHLDDHRQYPVADRVLDRVLFIGCSPNYDPRTLDYIDEVIRNFES